MTRRKLRLPPKPAHLPYMETDIATPLPDGPAVDGESPATTETVQ
ncbi:hypothetical protein [Devosia pacifica]|nr:hypothetical protein [Devosia pacifica]